MKSRILELEKHSHGVSCEFALPRGISNIEDLLSRNITMSTVTDGNRHIVSSTQPLVHSMSGRECHRRFTFRVGL